MTLAPKRDPQVSEEESTPFAEIGASIAARKDGAGQKAVSRTDRRQRQKNGTESQMNTFRLIAAGLILFVSVLSLACRDPDSRRATRPLTAAEEAAARKLEKALVPVQLLLYEEVESTPERLAKIWGAFDSLLTVLDDVVEAATHERAYGDVRGLMRQCMDGLLSWNDRSTVTHIRRSWEEVRETWASTDPMLRASVCRWTETEPGFRSTAALDSVQDVRVPEDDRSLKSAFSYLQQQLERLHRVAVAQQAVEETHVKRLRVWRGGRVVPTEIRGHTDLLLGLPDKLPTAPRVCLEWKYGNREMRRLARIDRAWSDLCHLGDRLYSWMVTPWKKDYLERAKRILPQASTALRRVRLELVALDVLTRRELEVRDDEWGGWTRRFETGGFIGLRDLEGQTWPRLGDDPASRELADAVLRAGGREIDALRGSSTPHLLILLDTYCRVAETMWRAPGFRNQALGLTLRWSIGQRLGEQLVKEPLEAPAIAAFLRECRFLPLEAAPLRELVEEELGDSAAPQARRAAELHLQQATLDSEAVHRFAEAFAKAKAEDELDQPAKTERETWVLIPDSPARIIDRAQVSTLLWMYLTAAQQSRALGGLLSMMERDGSLDREKVRRHSKAYWSDKLCYICTYQDQDWRNLFSATHVNGKHGYISLFWDVSMISVP